jgi:hypothetical protein
LKRTNGSSPSTAAPRKIPGGAFTCSEEFAVYSLANDAQISRMLGGDPQVIAEWFRNRFDHFMNPALFQNQFDTLEEPRDAIVVSIAPEAIVNAIIVKGRLDRAADRRCSK